MVVSFLNVLSSKDAIERCGTGGIGGMMRVFTPLFSSSFKEELKFDVIDNTLFSKELPQLKTFLLKAFDLQGQQLSPDMFPELDRDFLGNLLESGVVRAFLTHLQNQDFQEIIRPRQGGETLYDIFHKEEKEDLIQDINLLILDTGLRVYFSEFLGRFIRNDSLSSDQMHKYFEESEYINLK